MSTHTPEPNVELRIVGKRPPGPCGQTIPGPELMYLVEIRKSDYGYLKDVLDNQARIRECFFACAGMADPAKEIAELKAEVERLKRLV